MRKWFTYIILIALLFGMMLWPIDAYYITKPGTAYPLSPIVEVAEAKDSSEGHFYLMTVAVIQATPFTLGLSFLSKDMERVRAEKMRGNSTDEEYIERQRYLMEYSKQDAIRVAFETLQLPVNVQYEGNIVLSVLSNSEAARVFQPKDEIIAINDIPLKKEDDMAILLNDIKKDERYEITYKREGTLQKTTCTMRPLPGERRLGLGVRYIKKEKLQTTPHVTIDSSTIGGPSAGLMFTLEIMNQLTEEDLTKGYEVAGTGEIEPSGAIGRIGGVDQKVIAADRQGISVFFAPDDEYARELKKEGYPIETNYEEAVATAKSIQSDMKIVPVRHVKDALEYLQNLEPLVADRWSREIGLDRSTISFTTC